MQNFVDHNSAHPGTLDGVRFTSEPLKSGGRRFRIEGDWPFVDPTGVLSPHSDKPEGINTAGGNGIGLKQTAIRFLRDFGVTRFEIDGEGWAVNYRLAKAADVNNDWASMPGQAPQYRVTHDWLLAEISQTKPTGRNAYIIETANEQVIKALEQLPTLGVSRENPYLQNMDYQNEFGAIKWLPKTEGTEPVRGRLFINGQVMNYKTKGATAEDYWVGPESVTVVLNNLEYRMSIDRPPIFPLELSIYMTKMVGAMSKDEVVEQLKRSEHLWGGQVDSGSTIDKQGAFAVIETLVNSLSWGKYDRREYEALFGGKNYICADRGVSEAQIKELSKQGYIICPTYFEQIGMPTASSKLSSVEAASNEAPRVSRNEREQFAQEYGMEAAWEEFPDVKTPSEFIALVSRRLAGEIVAVEENEGNPNVVRLKLRRDIPRDLLFHPLPRPKGDDQQLVYLLRGIVGHGLEKRIFKRAFTSQGEFVTTFALDYDFVSKERSLFVRNIPNKSDRGVFMEIELDEKYIDEFLNAFKIGKEVIRDEGQQTSQGGAVADKGKLAQIPVSQPEAPRLEAKRNVIQKEVTMSEPERARLSEVEAVLPGIAEAVDKLAKLVPEAKIQETTGGGPTEKYLAWRGSDKFYGQLGQNAGYLTGRHLLELVSEQNRAEIAGVETTRERSPQEKELGALQSRLKEVVRRMSPAEDDVDEFEIVLEPTESQLAQLGLLRFYTQLTTGVALPNDLFIYQGTGRKGINLGQKAIGMHESLFAVKFSEAMRTFTHEIAHNFPGAMNHDNAFRHAMESLFAAMIERTSQIARKLAAGQEITQEEKVILDMRNQWDKLAEQGRRR